METLPVRRGGEIVASTRGQTRTKDLSLVTHDRERGRSTPQAIRSTTRQRDALHDVRARRRCSSRCVYLTYHPLEHLDGCGHSIPRPCAARLHAHCAEANRSRSAHRPTDKCCQHRAESSNEEYYSTEDNSGLQGRQVETPSLL
jgi:hypothetical protein